MDKRVLIIMGCGFLISSTCAATIMGLVLSNFSGVFPCFRWTPRRVNARLMAARAQTLAGLSFCIPINVPKYLFAFWIPTLAFESLLCGMSIFRGFQAFRYRHSVFESGKQLVNILLRDSIIYFLMFVFLLLFFFDSRLAETVLQYLSHIPGQLLALEYRHRQSSYIIPHDLD